MHDHPRQPLSALRGGGTEPDLEGEEEDIINISLAKKGKEIQVSTFFQNMITAAICLNFTFTTQLDSHSTLMCTA